MERNVLMEKIHSKLVENDKLIDDIDKNRKDLELVCQEEKVKIDVYCKDVEDRLHGAILSLKNKSSEEFNKFDKQLITLKEKVKTNSLKLCPEYEKLRKVNHDQSIASLL